MIKRQTEIVYKIRDMMKIGEEIKKRRTEEKSDEYKATLEEKIAEEIHTIKNKVNIK